MDRRTFISAAAVAFPACKLVHALSAIEGPPLTGAGVLATCRVPGLALCGTHREERVWEAFGEASAATHAPIDEHTVFPAASMTKAVFSLAVRQLARAKKFDLDVPLAHYGDVGLSGDCASRITARHVLTHTSGLPNWLFDAKAPLEAKTEPGHQWAYSGEGFVALQRAVEQALQQPIGAYMDSRFLASLGMQESTVSWKPELRKRAAVGHDSSGDAMEKSLIYYAEKTEAALRKASVDPATVTTEGALKALAAAGQPPLRILVTPNMAGSLWTTPADFARFTAALLADAKQNAREYEPQVQAQGLVDWSLAGAVDRSDQNAVFQYGDGPGYKNLLWLSPRENAALAFFTNGERGALAYSWLFRQKNRRDTAVLYWV